MTACNGLDPTNADDDGISDESAALIQQALTKAEEKTTLKLIDDICGDTWCSGDYNFGFRSLLCDQKRGTCTLRFQIFPREGVVSEKRSYWRSCKTDGFSDVSSLVATAPNGYQSLAPTYYDALTTCIQRVESNLR